MSSERDEKERIFEAASEIDSAEERAVYLKAACGGNLALFRELEELLRHDEATQGFLATPAIAALGVDARRELGILEGPGTVIGRYTLVEQIGEGAFGLVFVAEQSRPVRRRVALKIIKPGMDTLEVMTRFDAERQALALMDHPSISRVFDAGMTDSGRPYFVMELVQGVPITDYCDQEALAPRARLELFVQICRAVQHAHTSGIIHRDLKPSNILAATHDGATVVKVIDFGIAKAIGGKLTDQTVFTSVNQVMGTPLYMSPEQAELNSVGVDARSDVYSLGVLLYELLTGTTPFERERFSTTTFDRMRRVILEEDPPRPSTRLTSLGDRLAAVTARRGMEPARLATLVRGDLDWIVMKALEKDRSRRYETVNDFRLDVERYIEDQPIVARPPSAVYRLRKMWRRHRLEWTAAALVLLSLVAGMAASVLEARRAERQRGLAERSLYAANLNLVEQAWQRGSTPLVRELLAETESFAERGFEWYAWQLRVHRARLTLHGHTVVVRGAAYSPDGRRLVTGGQRSAIVWDVATGQILRRLSGHRSAVSAVAISRDGGRLVTGSFDYTGKVWDASSYEELLTLRGHDAVILSLAISPDGERIATASEDRTAIVWDAHTGARLRTLETHTDRVHDLAFSPDGRQIVTGSWDETAIVWDVATGAVVARTPALGSGIEAVAWSADGSWIAVGRRDGEVALRDARRDFKDETGRLLTGQHTGSVMALAFSPDHRLVLSGGSDSSIVVWEVETGEPLWTLHGHASAVESIALSPDGREIATASADGTARIWPASPPDDPFVIDAHENAVESIALPAVGNRIVSGDRDGAVRVWDGGSGELERDLAAHRDRVAAIAVSPDGRRIVTASWDQTVAVWNVADGTRVVELEGHPDRVWSASFAPDGTRIVTGCEDGAARVWNAEDGSLEQSIDAGGGRILDVAFSPDGTRLAAACGDGSVRIGDRGSETSLRSLGGHTGSVLAVAWTGDGAHVATSSADGTARLWDIATGGSVPMQGHVGPVTDVAVSTDGRRVVTSGQDGSVKLWDPTTGKQLLTLDAGKGGVRCVALPTDGRRIMAGCDDGGIRIWRCATPREVQEWSEAERAGKARAAARQEALASAAERERQARLTDVGAIRQWLLAAPIRLSWRERSTISDDARLASAPALLPRAGAALERRDRRVLWRPVRLDNNHLEFGRLVGETSSWSAAWALSYVWSEHDRPDLTLAVGSDDQARVLINGVEVYRRELPRPYIRDHDIVTEGIELRAGRNVILFEVFNETGDWGGSLRIADRDGRPLEGIRVTLDPDDDGTRTTEAR